MKLFIFVCIICIVGVLSFNCGQFIHYYNKHWVSDPINPYISNRNNTSTLNLRSTKKKKTPIKRKTNVSINCGDILVSDKLPPCHVQPKLRLVWYGKEIPFMYKVAVESMKKLYQVEIFNVTEKSLHDILLQLTGIHEMDTWKTFINKIEKGMYPGPHYADFLRVALIYLYGGIYSDFDSLWLKKLPPFKLLMVEGPSNGVLGGYPKNKWLYNVLKYMPTIYDPTSWNSIGAKLLKKSLESLQDSNDFTFIKYKDMYTIGWKDAYRYYNYPYDQLKDVQMGYQLHMFGKMTKIVNNNIPVENSLYANVIKDIGIVLCQTHLNGFKNPCSKNPNKYVNNKN